MLRLRRLSKFRSISREDLILDQDEEPLSYDEEMTLRHASSFAHSSPTYPRTCCSNSTSTNAATTQISIERILSESYTVTPSSSNSRMQHGDVTTSRSPSIMKRLSRLSFISSRHASPLSERSLASGSPDNSILLTTPAPRPSVAVGASTSTSTITSDKTDPNGVSSSSGGGGGGSAAVTSSSAGGGMISSPRPAPPINTNRASTKDQTTNASKASSNNTTNIPAEDSPVMGSSNISGAEPSHQTSVKAKRQSRLSPLITEKPLSSAATSTSSELKSPNSPSSPKSHKSAPPVDRNIGDNNNNNKQSSTGRSIMNSAASTASTPMLMSSPSMIFERSVQDIYPESINNDSSSSHHHNEDFIPPVLEASANAITDNTLDPELVDVISLKHHGRHLSARSLSMSDSFIGSPSSAFEPPRMRERSTTGSSSILPPSPIGLGMSHSSLSNSPPSSSAASTDRHVLSFYSFADIVSSEHLPHTAATSPGKLSPISNGSMSPSRYIPKSPVIDDEDITVTSMGETLRRHTELSAQESPINSS